MAGKLELPRREPPKDCLRGFSRFSQLVLRNVTYCETDASPKRRREARPASAPTAGRRRADRGRSDLPEARAVRSSPLMIDLAIAVLCAVAVLIVSPGVAVDAVVALIVLAGCGASLALVRRRRRGERPIPGYEVGRHAPRRSRRLRR